MKLPSRPSRSDGRGFLAGLFAYVLFLNYLRYGPAGVKGWLSAKFLNQPMTAPDTDDGSQ